MGLLLGKIIPMSMLAQLPRPFVHRLRDIRMKQLEEQNKEQERMMKEQETNQRNMQSRIPAPSRYSGAGASLEDFIDELT